MTAPTAPTAPAYPRARRNPAPLTAPWVRLVREPSQAPRAGLQIKAPATIAALLGLTAAQEEVEVFYLVCLSAQNRVTAQAEVTRGTLTASLVHPREVFQLAIANGAAAIIVAHNHPSGDPTPSAEDRAITRQLVEAGRMLDIPVYDHIILGGERWYSFAEAGLL